MVIKIQLLLIMNKTNLKNLIQKSNSGIQIINKHKKNKHLNFCVTFLEEMRSYKTTRLIRQEQLWNLNLLAIWMQINCVNAICDIIYNWMRFWTNVACSVLRSYDGKGFWVSRSVIGF